jgi:hypothetical protein
MVDQTSEQDERETTYPWCVYDVCLLLIYCWIEFWFVNIVPKYSNCSALSKELLSIFILWIRPAFWSRDMTMYLVFFSIYS